MLGPSIDAPLETSAVHQTLAALAPTTILADAPALGSASGRGGCQRIEYGWVRGTGSAVFIAGTLLSGQAVGAFGLDVIVWLQGGLLGVAVLVAIREPAPVHDRTAEAGRAPVGGVLVLLRLRGFDVSCSWRR